MKRTLIEVLCGLAVIVMMVSFNNRVSRLQTASDRVAELGELVRETAANAGSKSEIASSRQEILAKVSARLESLQTQLESAQQDAREASFLRDEIEATRRESSLLRAELTRDVQCTKTLVSTYQNEMRESSTLTLSTIDATQRRIDELAGSLRRDHSELNAELLAPTVQLNGDDTVGSGTLIRSERDPSTGKAANYVITSYHVVRNILTDSPRAKVDGILVTIYQGSENVDVRGRMIGHNEAIDIALLELETDRVFERIARIMPRDRADQVGVWDDVYALGCPLGNDPIPTTGELSSKHNVLNGTNYWMINAPTYYGNSGGGVYLAEGNYLIGVFSKIYTHGKGNPIVVPHMGLCTPITSIYEWLDRESLAYVIPTGARVETAAGLAAPPAAPK